MSVMVNQSRGARSSPKRRARAYRYRLTGLQSWQVYVGPVRNREEATRALMDMFGDCLTEVRVHPVCDPWPKASKAENEQRTSRRHRRRPVFSRFSLCNPFSRVVSSRKL